MIREFAGRASLDAPHTQAAQGPIVGGYWLYVRDGKPTLVYNYLGLERYTITGDKPPPRRGCRRQPRAR